VSAERRRALLFGLAVIVLFVLSTAINPDTRERAIGAAQTLVTTITGTAHNMSTGPGGSSAGDSFALEDNRRYLIAAGVKMFTDHPLTGVGFGGYQHAITTAYRGFIPAEIPNPDTVSHTVFVTVAAEQGILGVTLLLVFFAFLAREAWRARRNLWATTAATMIVPIVLYAQFEGRLLEEPYFWVFLALFYAAAAHKVWSRDASPTM
jgi:O-antigen ligase